MSEKITVNESWRTCECGREHHMFGVPLAMHLAALEGVRRETIGQCVTAIEAFANMACDSAFARTAAKQLAEMVRLLIDKPGEG